jgi:hypothetical protein
LVENTGRTWQREECLAALWAYDRTYLKSISRQLGEPVAEVAVNIGRAVSGVYNKVMNFRAIDPREARSGFSGTNKVDHEVWQEFFDPATNSLRSDDLERQYHELWGETSAMRTRPRTYTDFGEAPDDDPSELAQFSAKVRKGQPTLRKKLLQLYGSRCSISGDGPEAVLEAAHISLHSDSGVNHSSNGLLLRADLHTLFDVGLLRIDPEQMRVVLNSTLKETSYWTLNGVVLRPRSDGSLPSLDYLRARWAASAQAYER